MCDRDLFVIECRAPEGPLDFEPPLPETVFGLKAITGITSDEMAKVLYRALPDAVLDGRTVLAWPSRLDPRWAARRKTW